MNELAKSLEEITDEAKILYNRIERDYARWGELMLEAKKLVPHGQWLKYLEENFPAIGQRQANRYMQLTKENKTLSEVTSRGTQIPNSTLSLISSLNKPKNTVSDYAITKAFQEKLRSFEQRSKVMNMHIREFLTIEEPVGRDIVESINNIDKFDSQEDIAQLRMMQEHCERLAIRAAELAIKLKRAIEKKEKLI